MSHKTARKLVLMSVETDDGDRCVDVFERPDGSFGFEAYRRDSEDPRGWYATGGFEQQRFASEDDALAAARLHAPWAAWQSSGRHSS